MKKLLCLFAVLIAILLVYYFAISNVGAIMEFFDNTMKDAELEKRGQFGDSTAIINTLFSALALFGVLATLLYQMWDNKEQKRLSDISRFEQNFFTMTENLENIVANLTYIEHFAFPFSQSAPLAEQNSNAALEGVFGNNMPSPAAQNHDITIKGREIFEYLYNRQTIANNITGIKHAIENGGIQSYEQAMSHGILDHYFRYLYRIMKYVDDCELFKKDAERKQYYVSVLRAQVSCYELLMLFYNCQLSNHYKFKTFIERYTFFNNLRTELLATDDERTRYDSKIGDQHQVDAEVMPPNEYAKSAFMRPCEYQNDIQQRRQQPSLLRRCIRDIRTIGNIEERFHRIEVAVQALRGRTGV